jgi:hypothetical protein
MKKLKEIARLMSDILKDIRTRLILNADDMGSQELADRKKRDGIIPLQPQVWELNM